MPEHDQTTPVRDPEEPRGAVVPLVERFGDRVRVQPSPHTPPSVWTEPAHLAEILDWLRREADPRFEVLLDLYGVDERVRRHRPGPERDFTVVYHLLSPHRDEDVRVLVPLRGDPPSLPSITGEWPVASWYEREAFDMYGIRFDGHPHLRRILMPPTWQGHPLRKDHPARASEMGPYELPRQKQEKELEALRFRPEDWGLSRGDEETDFLFLNVGPQHPGTHGVLRVVLQLAGERIVDAVPDIGYHHRGAEKMAERQTWHTFIPYTDRIDYLGGVLNNLPYVMALEKLAGIEVPERAQVIRILLCELFRLSSHLVWYGTFAQDVGQMSPVFYMFTDRERILEVVEAVCGDRMHPNWLRIGGVAQDLPRGWEQRVQAVLDELPAHLDDYEKIVMRNEVFRARTMGVGAYDTEQALAWGVTGPGLRATGLEFDLRKARPYGGYERFDFEIPTATAGDCYARAQVRVEEMRQSLRIVRQCLEGMPEGDFQADHPLATPPRKARTMEDIETLIHHFLSVSWGPVMPVGETCMAVEASKGINAYTLISDGTAESYRTRIRTPSFPHMQMLPEITRGRMVPDLLAVLGSIDYVLADVDR